MHAIWCSSEDCWEQAADRPFSEEKELHDLVERNPRMLSPAGVPGLAVVGREVPLGSGYADLLGVELSGQPVIVEVKLAKNQESRQKIIGQMLGYAAELSGLQLEALEDRLRGYLNAKGHDSLVAAVRAEHPAQSLDDNTLRQQIRERLRHGEYKLVLVLDEVPSELEQIVTYLKSTLPFDLIAIRRFGSRENEIALVRRISGSVDEQATANRLTGTVHRSSGAQAFRDSYAHVEVTHREEFDRLVEWAQDDLTPLGVALVSGVGSTYTTLRLLLPKLPRDQKEAGLVTIYNSQGRASIVPSRSVWERRAPSSIEAFEGIIDQEIGSNTPSITDCSEEVLKTLTNAYEEAVRQNG